MSTSQIALLVVFIVIIDRGMFYFMAQPKIMVRSEAKCVAAAIAECN